MNITNKLTIKSILITLFLAFFSATSFAVTSSNSLYLKMQMDLSAVSMSNYTNCVCLVTESAISCKDDASKLKTVYAFTTDVNGKADPQSAIAATIKGATIQAPINPYPIGPYLSFYKDGTDSTYGQREGQTYNVPQIMFTITNGKLEGPNFMPSSYMNIKSCQYSGPRSFIQEQEKSVIRAARNQNAN